MTTMARPHIILISTDQQRADTIAAPGHAHMITPHLDALCRDGVAFTQAFAPAATCVSSRCAFYTGHYPHTTGVMGFDGYTGRQNWTHRLASAGYRCINIGKTHIGGSHHGYHERIADQRNKAQPTFVEDGVEPSLWARELRAAGHAPPNDLHHTVPNYDQYLTALPWSLPEEWHYDTWLGRKAVEHIRGLEADAGPRFLHIGFLGPHEPYDPCQRFIDLYEGREIPMPHVTDSERKGIPDELFSGRRFRDTQDDISAIKTPYVNEASVRRMRKHYYANVTQIDESVGRIIGVLKEKGIYENALILFTSDHGDHLLDHDLIYKGDLYDTVVNIPLLVKPPGGGNGRACAALVSQLDAVQYLLQSAGVEAGDLAGKNLGPLLTGEVTAIREYAYAQEGSSKSLRPEPEVLTMIRSLDWKLIRFPDPNKGMLFDLRSDPGETRNLWDDPGAREARMRLGEALSSWQARSRWACRNLYEHAR